MAELELPFTTPTFASVEEERAHVKARLAASLRIFGRLGFGEGVAGHITARDPEHPDCFWVNPFAMSFHHIRVSDLLLVDHHGDAARGHGAGSPRRWARARPTAVGRGRPRASTTAAAIAAVSG